MSNNRRSHSSQFKFQVALEAASGTKTLSQLASQYQVHPNQIGQWKRQLLEQGAEIFANGQSRKTRDQEGLQTDLYEQIGRLKMELEWLKKKAARFSLDEQRAMIDVSHPVLSIRRQCDLLGLWRSSFYYQPAVESPENLLLMRLIDEQYLKTPFYGRRRMSAHLERLGDAVNPKRVGRLMSIMGLRAIYPQPKTSLSGLHHKVYPYLLRDLAIVRPNQVWSADITYIPMRAGFMYLVAIIDWFSRYVLAWRLSNTLDSRFCCEVLEIAFAQVRPAIFNSDQGVQFTAQACTDRLEQAGVRISMDGRGRAFDNIFIERLWRSVKYEEVYLHDYETVLALEAGLERYFSFYNKERPHQALGYRVPTEVHFAQS
ncbi:MAG: IS3 family transposase [Thaumarchaeota archaeon]|nr:IS3 family transposase [Nitrososphaerota archaeon]